MPVQEIFKKRVALGNGKLLGSILFFKDAQGRECFKFSMKAKLASVDVWHQDRDTGERKPLVTGAENQEMSIDVSYKFVDNLLEMKQQEAGGQDAKRNFIRNMPVPPSAYLFLVRIKDWTRLPDVQLTPDTLVINHPNLEEGAGVAVIFSFAGIEGKPFMPEEYITTAKEGRTVSQQLPLPAPFDKIWIGTVEDMPNDEAYDVSVKAPNFS